MATNTLLERPVTSLPALLSSTAIFLSVALTIHKFSPFTHAPTLIKVNNRLYALFSLLLFLALLASTPWPTDSHARFAESVFCQSSSMYEGMNWWLRLDRELRYAFHLSKLYEYVDIFLVVATGRGRDRVGLHFLVHHLSVSLPSISTTL